MSYRPAARRLPLSVLSRCVEFSKLEHAASLVESRTDCPYVPYDGSSHAGALKNGDGSSRPLEGARVLVVEDNAPLRTAIVRFLEGAGSEILAAGTPSDALAIARADENRIDVALIDLILPEMSGPEFSDVLREDRPDVAIVYMSGYAESVSDGFPEDDTPVLLPKPFAREELIRTIRGVLGR